MSLGHTIKLLRHQKEITQSQLGQLLNLKRSTIAGYETDRKQPDLDTLVKIADYFDVSMDFLTGRTVIKPCFYKKASNISSDYELTSLLDQFVSREDLQSCIRNLSKLTPTHYSKVISIIDILTAETK